MTDASKLIRGIIALIAAALVVGVIALNPITLGVAGGVLWSRSYNKSLGDAYAERNFERVCPEYKAASTWDRWFDQNLRLIGWCDDYIDRL